jgi:hypothetical protein
VPLVIVGGTCRARLGRRRSRDQERGDDRPRTSATAAGADFEPHDSDRHDRDAVTLTGVPLTVEATGRAPIRSASMDSNSATRRRGTEVVEISDMLSSFLRGRSQSKAPPRPILPHP